MDNFFSNYSDPHFLFGGLDSQSSHYVPHSPVPFSTTTTTTAQCHTANTFSDEDVILASNLPKKRAGRMKFRETRHPVYRGVRKRNNNKWVCEVREPKKKTRIWLGTYATPEMAARAHDVAAMAFRGRSACLNFADSVWRLPVPASLNAKDIRKAAAEAAKAFDQQQQQQHNSQVEITTSISSSRNTNNKKKKLEKSITAPEKVFYMDMEAEFEMPRLLADMAEGLLLSPPISIYSLVKSFNWDDVVEYNAEVSLWNYSI